MKKIFSAITFVLSCVLIFVISYYPQWPTDYRNAELLGYVFWWLVTMFILSLFSFILETKKYKIWLSITLLFSILSVCWAYRIGDGSGSLISFDGEMTTWLLIGLYSIISIIYFIIQFFKKRKKTI